MGVSVRIEKQFVRIEAVPVYGIIRAVNAKAVDRARSKVLYIAVPNLVCEFRQLNALQLLFARLIDKAEFDFSGMCGEKSEVNSIAVPGCASWVRGTLTQFQSFPPKGRENFGGCDFRFFGLNLL